MTLQIRQGDIFLIKLNNAPSGVAVVSSEDNRITVGHGEVTGHQHVLTGADWLRQATDNLNRLDEFARRGGQDIYVQSHGCEIVHEEHESIHVPAGVYRVIRQREYRPKKNIYVLD